jgi:Mn-dependent DtxR family transcriptional regulator
VKISVSSNPKKKIDVYKDEKKLASIGDINYSDYGTYLEKKGKKYADERRRLYRIRHKGEDNWSLKILW